MFLLRVARNLDKKWILSVIEDFDSQARCFGSLIPEIKSYTADLIPSIVVNPDERIAVLRKGEQVRIKDFAQGKIPKWVSFGLQWDVTDGVNIDLDASAVCLARDLRPLDVVYFKQLRSKDNSIRHSGDEQEGDESGDDEKILISLPNTSPDVHYIGFVINSYSGQELDDIAKASCHLYDPQTGIDIATYSMSNATELDGHTALLVGCLFREGSDAWNLRIIAKPVQGKTAHSNVEDLQQFLFENAPVAPQVTPAQNGRILNTMPPPVEKADNEAVVPAAEFNTRK
jgi:tellurium resistance protein TerZ